MTTATHAYVGYRAGSAVMVSIDDGSPETRRAIAKHLKGKDCTIERMPMEQAQAEIRKALAARKTP